MKADVLFIHGLLGAAFKTWRQKDRDLKLEDVSAGDRELYAECWPKVNFCHWGWGLGDVRLISTSRVVHMHLSHCIQYFQMQYYFAIQVWY